MRDGLALGVAQDGEDFIVSRGQPRKIESEIPFARLVYRRQRDCPDGWSVGLSQLDCRHCPGGQRQNTEKIHRHGRFLAVEIEERFKLELPEPGGVLAVGGCFGFVPSKDFIPR